MSLAQVEVGGEADSGMIVVLTLVALAPYGVL